MGSRRYASRAALISLDVRKPPLQCMYGMHVVVSLEDTIFLGETVLDPDAVARQRQRHRDLQRVHGHLHGRVSSPFEPRHTHAKATRKISTRRHPGNRTRYEKRFKTLVLHGPRATHVSTGVPLDYNARCSQKHR